MNSRRENGRLALQCQQHRHDRSPTVLDARAFRLKERVGGGGSKWEACNECRPPHSKG